MLLREVTDPVACWEYAERYLGVGTRTYSAYAADLEISPPHHPLTGQRSFLVPTFRVPHGQGCYLRGLGSDLHRLYTDGEGFLLPVHPDTLAFGPLHRRAELLGCRSGPAVEVVPSANTRTVFVKRIDGAAVPAHFLKLHYPRRLSRFTRRLRRPVIALQLWVAAELARVGVAFLPEVGGAVFGPDPREAWGFVLREATPAGAPLVPTVPLFALYGADHHAPEQPTLLEQLVAASGEKPCDYLTERVIGPMVELWCDVVARTGCALEPHGQNTLFTFTAEGTGICYRDCAVYVDPAIRAELGLGGDLPEVNVISRDVGHPRGQVFSLTYDSFMGNHALSYLARLAQRCWGVEPEVLHAAAQSRFTAAALLPDTVFYYGAELPTDGRWSLVDTGQAPLWR